MNLSQTTTVAPSNTKSVSPVTIERVLTFATAEDLNLDSFTTAELYTLYDDCVRVMHHVANHKTNWDARPALPFGRKIADMIRARETSN